MKSGLDPVPVKPLRSPAQRSAPTGASDRTGTALIHAATTALWMSCAVVGTLGMVIPYTRPKAPAKDLPAVVAERLVVDLKAPRTDAVSSNPDSPADDTPAPAADQQAPDEDPPPSLEAATPADAPPLAAVATPSPAIAFALPVAAPARIVDPKRAVPVAAPASVPPPVRRLTFGVGEGAQPNPEYPRAAMLARQSGIVGIRLTVETDGRVSSVRVETPSRWPILNESAARAVREQWHFEPGPQRVYDVSIEFRLKER